MPDVQVSGIGWWWLLAVAACIWKTRVFFGFLALLIFCEGLSLARELAFRGICFVLEGSFWS
jgi:hypothetical protein